ncbi:ABC transporter permease [Sinorhizobium numidicum]|uniref:ABC transporter permease n=1 Tax=Sinorhizobium numidicum TaxID=680248 RepID=A0ABY8CN83_9HYPH|nr:ABC transporter permease [Sinorhizobium numidicum]WEX74133.1 ABC transporter permease [Sinorhizobium numidicum]WEX80118.1 ABC transporter permease [Sinorhizobium numidicum]
MIKAIFNRLLQAVLVALLVGLLTFVMARSLPGDLAYRIAAGRYGYDLVGSAAAAKVSAELDLGQSALAALGRWFMDLVRLDLGTSLVTGAPVIDEISHHLGHTIKLSAAAILLSLLIGPPLGIFAGLRPGGVLDRGLLLVSTALRALPQFVVGLILIIVFGLMLQLLPTAGHDRGGHLILPALTLALGLAAVSNRVARDAMLSVSRSPYYTFGRTKGLSGWQVFLRHGLRNVAVPIVTYLGIQFVYLVEGVVVVETLFAWPGIGHALVHAIFGRDVPVIQGTALVMGLMFVALNALVDALCHLTDPRRAA